MVKNTLGMVGVYFNSSSTLCNKQNSCLRNIAMSPSPILWSISRWRNLKLTYFYSILLMIVYLYTHTHTLIQTHTQVYSESINFKIKFVFTTSFFCLACPPPKFSTTGVSFMLPLLCRYLYVVNATTFTSMVHMILSCFCKALIHDE